MPKGGVNVKKEAGRAKKAESESKKQAVLDQQTEAQQAAEWAKGANQRKQQKESEAAQKADEAARKKREKEELLAAEAEALGSGGKPKASSTAKSKGKAKKNDLAFLEDALVKAADKNVKKKKEEAIQKKMAEEQKARETKVEAPLDPLMQNTEYMLGDSDTVGRQANLAKMGDEAGATGIDAALDHLSISGGNANVPKSAKALYNDFEARMLPQMKEEYPGLRLTQYKEKVWALWKKSAENPANQVSVS
ncbi:hypothetical protein MPSEU_000698800 [Mayamaea pseudoterrestris]|nr:hypothetical protein MPSEU_000698800 [Mayamaea pseudoterrestris]